MLLIFYWLSSFLEIWSLFPELATMSLMQLTTVQLVLDVIALILLLYLFYPKASNIHRQKFFSWSSLGLAIVIMILDFVLVTVYTQLVMVHQTDIGQGLYHMYSELFFSVGLWSIFLVLVHRCFFGPVLEELLCRKLLMSRFFKDSKYYLDVLFSALIFSLGHLSLIEFSLAYFIYYLIPGVLYGFLYRKTKSVYYGMALHCLWNIYANWPYWLRWFNNVMLWIKLKF